MVVTESSTTQVIVFKPTGGRAIPASNTQHAMGPVPQRADAKPAPTLGQALTNGQGAGLVQPNSSELVKSPTGVSPVRFLVTISFSRVTSDNQMAMIKRESQRASYLGENASAWSPKIIAVMRCRVGGDCAGKAGSEFLHRRCRARLL